MTAGQYWVKSSLVYTYLPIMSSDFELVIPVKENVILYY